MPRVMGTDATTRAQVQTLLDATLRGELAEADAQRLYALGPEAVTLVLLATTQRLAQLRQTEPTPPAIDPATPSGQVPIYTKATASKRRKRPGAKPGHPGARRPRPEKIDERQDHRLPRCPHCDGKLQRSSRSRTRVIEDIPETIPPVVTEHTIHRDYCPRCKQHVEPVVPDALPRCAIGHHLISLTAWFHYGLGITINSIISILDHHLQTKIGATAVSAVTTGGTTRKRHCSQSSGTRPRGYAPPASWSLGTTRSVCRPKNRPFCTVTKRGGALKVKPAGCGVLPPPKPVTP